MPEEITNEDLLGKMLEIHADVKAGFKEAAEERQAMRDVIDNDLAGQGQVMALEGHVKEIARAVKRLEKARA